MRTRTHRRVSRVRENVQRSKTDAVKTLLAAGWTEMDVNRVLGPSPGATHRHYAPWWSYLDADEYQQSSPVVVEWVNWLESKN